MKKIFATSATAAIAAAAVGILSFGYSPAGCSCVDPLTALAVHAYEERVTDQSDFSAEAIEAALNRSLPGTPIRFGDFPYTAEDGCTHDSLGEIICNVAVERSFFLTRGYRVTYKTTNGLFSHATVEQATWL